MKFDPCMYRFKYCHVMLQIVENGRVEVDARCLLGMVIMLSRSDRFAQTRTHTHTRTHELKLYSTINN